MDSLTLSNIITWLIEHKIPMDSVKLSTEMCVIKAVSQHQAQQLWRQRSFFLYKKIALRIELEGNLYAASIGGEAYLSRPM